MAVVFQIPRNCLAALLIAQAVVLLPHLFRLPVWVSSVCVVCALWRLFLYTGRGFYPSGVLKTLLVFISIGAILYEYGNLLSLEPIVALLITTFALKLIEMKSRRDVLVVIYLAYFVAATHFLFEQGIVDGVYLLIAVVVITSALVALHETQERVKPMRSLLASAKLVAQAIPLTIIMFVVFPRIGPLWSVPGTDTKARTGPSDTMGPGDISDLANSTDLAFRVSFEGKTPSTEKLYWRGLVFSYFDGRRWSERNNDGKDWQAYDSSATLADKLSEPLNYTVTIEGNGQHWLYGMPVARSSTSTVQKATNFTLRSESPLEQRYQYQVTSWLKYRLAPNLSPVKQREQLQLPRGYNPKAIELALQMRTDSADKQAYIQSVLNYFNQQPFVYTLKPSKLGRDSVDEFLFDTRRGFCEHYASSFVFMMRAVGIPSRIVVGYQGGELNPFENYLLVHQYDAHAWAEVWLAGQGWVRVDPTAAVAPERVESSISDFLADEMGEESTLPFINLRELSALKWVRLRWDSVNYSWNKWVLNYDTELQMEVLEDWLGEVTGWKIALVVLISGGLVLLLVAFSLLKHGVKHRLHPIDRTYLRHARAVSKLGIERLDSEGANDFAARVSEQFPELADSASRIAYLYNGLRYNRSAGGGEAKALDELKRKLQEEVKYFLQASRKQSKQGVHAPTLVKA